MFYNSCHFVKSSQICQGFFIFNNSKYRAQCRLKTRSHANFVILLQYHILKMSRNKHVLSSVQKTGRKYIWLLTNVLFVKMRPSLIYLTSVMTSTIYFVLLNVNFICFNLHFCKFEIGSITRYIRRSGYVNVKEFAPN